MNEFATDSVTCKPIGFLYTDYQGTFPRYWSVSDVEGRIELLDEYAGGVRDIQEGQQIMVIFWFHQSPPFSPAHLYQTPPHRKEPRGLFSTCSPVRPNPLGISVLEVLKIQGAVIHVRGLDMLDGTPILDIKPYISGTGR